jgi:hypothetical protein
LDSGSFLSKTGYAQEKDALLVRQAHC